MKRARGTAAGMLATLVLAACSGGADPDDGDEPPSPAPTAEPAPAEPAPAPPKRFACYRLAHPDAVAPTSTAEPVDCDVKHTARTFAVGTVDDLVDGHLLAIDSQRVQSAVSRRCPRLFARYVGGSATDRRLSMLRTVWFTPTVEESDAGARWYRCDVIALAGDEQLQPLTGRLSGVLDRPAGRDRFAMCGTAAPGAEGFAHVACSGEHTWRAVDVVEFRGERYPGRRTVRERGRRPCEEAGADAADDSLDYRWGYEWPTKRQWRAGQTYGRCWVPSPAGGA